MKFHKLICSWGYHYHYHNGGFVKGCIYCGQNYQMHGENSKTVIKKLKLMGWRKYHW